MVRVRWKQSGHSIITRLNYRIVTKREKAMGGGGDTSGVSQSLTGTLLSFMQDTDSNGCIFVGPPGAAKSAIAKAMGNEAISLPLNLILTA